MLHSTGAVFFLILNVNARAPHAVYLLCSGFIYSVCVWFGSVPRENIMRNHVEELYYSKVAVLRLPYKGYRKYNKLVLFASPNCFAYL